MHRAVADQGGLGRRQVELVVFDISNSTEKAFKGVDVLTDSGAKAIIGPSTSEMAKAATPAANNRKTLLISPTASTIELAGIDDYFFRVYPTSASNARSLADYAATVANNQRVAILSNLANQAFVEPWQLSFAKRFKTQKSRGHSAHALKTLSTTSLPCSITHSFHTPSSG